MDLGLKGKTALITGGNKGIGAASAQRLASEGVDLMLTARNAEQLSARADEIRDTHGVACHTIPADLTETGAADRVAAAAIEALGHVDILVNSAGAAQGGVFWELPDQVWDDALALKFHGTVRMMRAVIPHMRARKAGRIVTIAGAAGKQPGPRMLPSGAANAALLAVTSGLAQEVAPDGIVVLAINPGGTKTERWNMLMSNLGKAAGTSADEVEAGVMKEVPMGHLGEPDDIARLVTFLASDAAGYMTGTSITADGGLTKAIA